MAGNGSQEEGAHSDKEVHSSWETSVVRVEGDWTGSGSVGWSGQKESREKPAWFTLCATEQLQLTSLFKAPEKLGQVY